MIYNIVSNTLTRHKIYQNIIFPVVKKRKLLEYRFFIWYTAIRTRCDHLWNIKIDTIPPERFDDVIIHLQKNFYAHEPLNQALNICQRGERNETLECLSRSILKYKLSHMAVDKRSSHIAAVVLGAGIYQGEIEKALKELDYIEDKNVGKILKLMYTQNVKLDLFTKYKLDKIFDVKILSVDSEYRHKGLAKILADKQIEIAASKGFKLIKGDVTGHYSQHLIASLGFDTEVEILYSEYRDENGKQIFKPLPPHDRFKIQAKCLGS